MLIITVETQAANVEFLLDGSLAGAGVDVLRSRVEPLLHSGVRRVLLDLAGVSSIDAAGVGELMHLFTTAAAAGGVVEIGRMSPHVRRVLDVSGVLGLVGVEEPGARSTCR